MNDQFTWAAGSLQHGSNPDMKPVEEYRPQQNQPRGKIRSAPHTPLSSKQQGYVSYDDQPRRQME